MRKLLITASNWAHVRNFHLPYIRAFSRIGWEVHVGCAGIPDKVPCVDMAIELPFEKRIAAPGNFLLSRRIRRLVREERYDLIITHTSLAAFFTRLALKGMRKRPRLVNVVHGYLFDDDTNALKKQLLLNAERLTARQTDLLLTMNEWDHRTALKYRLGKKIEKIPGMGVDFSELDAAPADDAERIREKYAIPQDAFVLIYAAEFSKRKSQHVLIEAMRYLPEKVRLVLCGEGEQLQACRELAGRLELIDRILFLGQVLNMSAWYRAADAAVASSRIEGLPFNVMEAMYLGLPVVASAVKGQTDLIRDAVNGLLYSYGNAKECAACVERLLRCADFRQELGSRAAGDSARYELSRVLPIVMRYFEDAAEAE